MTFLANLPSNLLYLGVFLAVLMVLVAAHELGHYLFARMFGMACEEFAVGMGGRPWILGRRRYVVPVEPGQDPEARGEMNGLEGGGTTVPAEVEQAPDGRTVLRETTLFTVRPYPLGGFVRIKGMMPQEDGSETRIPGGFFSKSPGKRWLVLAAGPLFSVVAGILLLIPGLMFYGLPAPTGNPIIGGLMREGAAFKAGLKVNDRIVRVDGVPTPTWFDIVNNVRDKGTKPIHLEVDRAGKKVDLTFVGKVDEEPSDVQDKDGKVIGNRRQTRLGALAETKPKPLTLGQSVEFGIKFPIITAVTLIERIAHPAELAKSVGGPGTMIKETASSVDEGPWAVIRLAGLLSVSVGIFNLLPFPPLDGGQMWIALVEMLRGGRRLSMATQERVIKLGFTMVLLLIGTVLVIDVRRITGLEQPDIVLEGKK